MTSPGTLEYSAGIAVKVHFLTEIVPIDVELSR